MIYVRLSVNSCHYLPAFFSVALLALAIQWPHVASYWCIEHLVVIWYYHVIDVSTWHNMRFSSKDPASEISQTVQITMLLVCYSLLLINVNRANHSLPAFQITRAYSLWFVKKLNNNAKYSVAIIIYYITRAPLSIAKMISNRVTDSVHYSGCSIKINMLMNMLVNTPT